MKKYKKILFGIIAILVLVVAIVVIILKIYLNIQENNSFEKYSQREYEIVHGVISDNEIDGNLEKVNMDYAAHYGIGVKVDSLSIKDDTIKAKINFNFDENMTIDPERFCFGYAVYDNLNNIYLISKNFSLIEDKLQRRANIYRELGIKKYKNDNFPIELARCSRNELVEVTDSNIIHEMNLFTKGEKIPKIQKMYIRVFDIGYDIIYDGYSHFEWIFEIDIPEKIYNK